MGKYTRIQIHILVIFLVELLEFENTGFCLDGKTDVAGETTLKTKGKKTTILFNPHSVTAVIASVLTTAPPLFPVFFLFTAGPRFASCNMERRLETRKAQLNS